LGFLLLAFIRLRRLKRQAALPERHIHVLGKFVSSSSFLFIFLGKLASQIQDVLNSSGKLDSSNTYLFNNFVFKKNSLLEQNAFILGQVRQFQITFAYRPAPWMARASIKCGCARRESAASAEHTLNR